MRCISWFSAAVFLCLCFISPLAVRPPQSHFNPCSVCFSINNSSPKWLIFYAYMLKLVADNRYELIRLCWQANISIACVSHDVTMNASFSFPEQRRVYQLNVLILSHCASLIHVPGVIVNRSSLWVIILKKLILLFIKDALNLVTVKTFTML